VDNIDIARNTDDLIYNLIFTEQNNFEIDIADYISDIYQYEDFVSNLKRVLKKSKVKIIESEVVLDSKTAVWKLKVNK
jgi:hypothetical protein